MKTNIILAIAFASVICLSLVGSARCDGTVISISPSSDTLPQSQIGKPFQINITISDVTNLWSWKVQLNWNPNVLNFTAISEGPFLKSAGETLFLAHPTNYTQGSIPELSDTILAATGANGSGVLANVTFQVLGGGQSDINLSETVLSQPINSSGQHPQITHTINNGQVIALGPPMQHPTDMTSTYVGVALLVIVILGVVIVLVIRRTPKKKHKRLKK